MGIVTKAPERNPRENADVTPFKRVTERCICAIPRWLREWNFKTVRLGPSGMPQAGHIRNLLEVPVPSDQAAQTNVHREGTLGMKQVD